MITGAIGEGARTRRLRDHLGRLPQPATTAPQLNPMPSRLRSAGPPGPSTAAGLAVAFPFLSPRIPAATNWPPPGAELAADRKLRPSTWISDGPCQGRWRRGADSSRAPKFCRPRRVHLDPSARSASAWSRTRHPRFGGAGARIRYRKQGGPGRTRTCGWDARFTVECGRRCATDPWGGHPVPTRVLHRSLGCLITEAPCDAIHRLALNSISGCEYRCPLTAS
jgi:hypothetical protein